MENTFGDRLRVKLAEQKISGSKLAAKLGTNRSSISTWILNKAKPRADDLVILAQELNTSIDWLLRGNTTTIENGPNGDQVSISKQEYIDYLKFKNEQLKEENSALKENKYSIKTN
ncbi:helix-turn-helix domain-containing protein [Aquirufa nivalisilvae]